MFYKITLVTVCLITNIINLRALTTVCTFMLFQTAILSVRFITNITHIRALTCVCAFMPFEIKVASECLITNITYITALTTVSAIMCYQTALCTGSLITYFTCIWMFTPAFITLYMKFIQSTLVKKQRLNIRIYFDRKNKYFYSNIYNTVIKNPLHFKNCYLHKCIT